MPDPTRALEFSASSTGAALGGVAGGVLVRAGDLASFRWLFALNVLSYMVFLAMLRGLPDGKVEHTAPRRDSPGFEVVFRDTFFMRLIVTDVSIALGFGFLFGFMPAYASKLGVGKATIGLMFMFGAVTVVVTQIPTLRWVSGRRRMRSLALMNAWFVVAFALMVATPYLTLGLAVAAIAVGQMLGGFGESILGAVRQPLTSDLAPPEVVGRYFGLASMVFQGGMGLANALGGVVMQHSMKLVWLVPLAVSVAGVLGSLALGWRAPAHVAMSP